MARKPVGDLTPTPLQEARVNLTWYARAMEDGLAPKDARLEVYLGDKSRLAKDIRIVLINTRER